VSLTLRRAALGATLALGTLLLLEGVLRLVGIGHPVRPRIILRLLDKDVTLPYVREDLQVFWSPTPGFKGSFGGKSVTINRLGVRGAEVEARRQEGAFRIGCFGDSITFGYGVNDDETYPVELGRSLPGVEVINAGVTGYSSYQALGLARRLLPELRPSVATLLIGWNDGNHRPVGDEEYARRIRAVAKVDARLDHLYIYRALKNIYLRTKMLQGLSRTKGTPKRRRVSVEEYEANLEAFVKECQGQAVRPVFIGLPHRVKAGEALTDRTYPDALAETAARLRIPLLGVGPLAANVGENDRFFLDSLHLTPEGNRILATLLAAQLKAGGIVPLERGAPRAGEKAPREGS
jgi:lysophospholipase L1-like esterase